MRSHGCCDSMPHGQSPNEDSGLQRAGPERNLNAEGRSFHVLRKFPGKFESANLNREIGRRTAALTRAGSTVDPIGTKTTFVGCVPYRIDNAGKDNRTAPTPNARGLRAQLSVCFFVLLY